MIADNQNLLLVHILSCVFMTGVIWLIQCVHYPSFAYIEKNQFESFSAFHQNSITFIVGPMMVIELLSGLYLLLQNNFSAIWLVLSILLVLTWVSTFLLSVPIHTRLVSDGYSLENIEQLVLTNWPRTLLWSLRSVLLMIFLFPGRY